MNINAGYELVAERPVLRFNRRLAHPVAAVWRAISDPAELGHWFPCGIQGRVEAGQELTFTFPQPRLGEPPMTITGSVRECEPPRLLVLSWGEDLLRFDLTSLGGDRATELRLTVWLQAAEKAARDAAGWHVCLDQLAAQLDGGAGAAPGREPTPEWRQLYEGYARRGFPTGAEVPGDA